jgi:hypothetical protein
MANHGAPYDRFDSVVLLSVPVDVVLARVLDRTNPFGSSAEDRAKIASDMATFEPLMRAGVDHEIATTAPVADIVAALERVAARADGRARESR